MILSTLRMLPLPNKRLEAIEILRSVLGPTQASQGCIACRIYEEDGPDQAILYCEKWESEDTLQKHIQSQLYRRILAAMDLSSQSPEVNFYFVSTIHSIDLVRQLRGMNLDPHTSNRAT